MRSMLPRNARRARHGLGQATSHAIAGPVLAGALSAAVLTGGGVAVAAVTGPPLQALPAATAAQVEAQAQADSAGERFRAERARAAAAERTERIAAEREAEAKRKAAAERRAKAEAKAERRAKAQAAAEAERAERASRAASRDPKGLAAGLAAERGWGADQFSCLDSLWTKESGWDHTADNPTSSAYGIPQALPGSKMASAGSDWETNPGTQIEWGLGYIADSYGTPCAAWAHSQANDWY